jgi:hypothetical protein
LITILDTNVAKLSKLDSLLVYEVRRALQEQNFKFDSIYAGNSKRTTAKPTIDVGLKRLRAICLNVVNFAGAAHYCMTPLNAVQADILKMIGFPVANFQRIELESKEPASKKREQ